MNIIMVVIRSRGFQKGRIFVMIVIKVILTEIIFIIYVKRFGVFFVKVINVKILKLLKKDYFQVSILYLLSVVQFVIAIFLGISVIRIIIIRVILRNEVFVKLLKSVCFVIVITMQCFIRSQNELQLNIDIDVVMQSVFFVYNKQIK